ncbi:Ca2+:H+ antiporter [Chishuiella changwenlii]|uniref:Ca2+:H+ antiporter n=1 Tax=Chishuiella changwenlii TaxID=1434701 RepID=A0A1M7B8F9_9FLAO|nr:ionic transporter y4hA [Chishuiella changwenlii]GGE96146.1 ionic transporter y4hA [Chishuiella changwenlii]SHL51262.1 Ca2+:H+ antiporter [Chishuiella changwenlii]
MNVENFLSRKLNLALPYWTIACPVIAVITLFFAGTLKENTFFLIFLGLTLVSSVLAAVHHAEVVAHKVGEPFGTIILALAITVIEVSLIVSLMLSEPEGTLSVLARDTVFAAVMIILTGIIGVCLLGGGFRFREQNFIKQGVSTALITLVSISILTLVLPNFLTTESGGEFSSSQLIFVAIISLILYGGFISVQTIRHRDYFLPQSSSEGETVSELHAEKPNSLTTISSLVLLLIALVAVVLSSKQLSPTIESIVIDLGAPKSLVGIIIAGVILLPEGLAAYKAAKKDRLQTSLNLALGSALASIGLTIPAVAIVCFVTGLKVSLGIGAKSSVLLVLSLFTVYLSLSSGRTNIQQGIVLLTLFATYLFTTIVP